MALSNPTRTLAIRSLGAGLNVAVEPLAAAADETTAERNMDHTGVGARTKRYGTESYADIYASGGRVRGQTVFRLANGTALHIAAFDDGIDVDLCKEISGVWTSFATGLTTGLEVHFTQALVPAATPSDSGTGTEAAAGKFTIYDSTKAWTDNQYRGYFLKITNGAGVGQVRLIAANNATTLKLSEPFEDDQTSSANSNYEISAAESILIYGNGTDATSRYNATDTPTGITGAAVGSVLAYWQERLLVAVGNTINFSAHYAASGTSDFNVVGIARSTTDAPITALIPHPTENVLLVFTAQDVRKGYFETVGTQAVFKLSDPIDNYGTAAARTVCIAGNDVIYLSEAGVRILGQQAEFTGLRVDDQVSTTIAPLISQIVDTSACAAVYSDQRYYLACQLDSTSSTNDTILVLDMRYPSQNSPRGAWKRWDGISATTLAEYSDRVHYGLANNGRVLRQCDSTSASPYADLTTAISGTLTTKSFDLGEPFIEKYFQYLDLQLKNLTGTLTITITVEDQDSRTVDNFDLSVGVNLPTGEIGTSELGFGLYGTGESGDSSYALANYIQERLGLAIDGHRIKFTFTNSRLNENFTLTSATCLYKLLGVGRQALDHIV